MTRRDPQRTKPRSVIIERKADLLYKCCWNWCISDIVFVLSRHHLSESTFVQNKNECEWMSFSTYLSQLIRLSWFIYKAIAVFFSKMKQSSNHLQTLKERNKIKHANTQYNTVTASSWSRLVRNKWKVISINFKAKRFVALKTHVGSNFPLKTLANNFNFGL